MGRFTKIWTFKESYVKFLGTGLSTNLNSFSINATLGIVTNQNGEILKYLNLKSYLFDTDYFLSICSIEEDVSFHEIQLNQLVQFIKKVQLKQINKLK